MQVFIFAWLLLDMAIALPDLEDSKCFRMLQKSGHEEYCRKLATSYWNIKLTHPHFKHNICNSVLQSIDCLNEAACKYCNESQATEMLAIRKVEVELMQSTMCHNHTGQYFMEVTSCANVTRRGTIYPLPEQFIKEMSRRARRRGGQPTTHSKAKLFIIIIVCFVVASVGIGLLIYCFWK